MELAVPSVPFAAPPVGHARFAYEVLDLIDSHRELRLRGKVILDGVGDDAGAQQ
jgi:hypothetical protein